MKQDSNNFLLDKVKSYRSKHHLIAPELNVISMDCALLGWHACIEWLESHDVDVHKAFNSEVKK